MTANPDILAQICANTRAEIAQRSATQPLEELKARAADAPRPRGFARALMDAAAAGRTGLIAEIKKASPSAGLIRADFDPAAIARAYRDAGAACLSVLTDTTYFQGTITHLQDARDAVDLPILRKDFILTEWQIYESRAIGADCILLIMAALTDDEARRFEELATGLDMNVLVEIHDQAELDRALGLQARLIGINNRDLKTMVTDIGVSERLAPQIPPERFVVGESGIRNYNDIQRLQAAGVQGVLVGESLMRQPDIKAATQALLGLASLDQNP
ncbi:MAG TPA: indole-3-glycerol phosphate synthase TrpC [Acidiphilium sp.]|nr:MAG: indole-3-glycerol phosphate synthase [Acidiphilium sp. 21-60-14]OYV89835.1 MAG: indole-3-glycerol phosphate synthase [Acidiphilium sp. 37-60-79]OZB38478.1 MAG: indole-3-glycerol phosphate synthase [Acidiphilium sp. 34-60-192]HQT88263.1 indole-3-glycerol phosphate synthase TrpC [Acidiphilium sp.]HQU24673.1 indole-3-glycerol phosphate synthase TrpC [Acidiphilium sp.]